MIRTLRRKILALIMGIVTLVVAVTFTVICLIDIDQGQEAVYSALDAALQEAENPYRQEGEQLGPQMDNLLDGSDEEEGQRPRGPRIGGAHQASTLPIALYYVSADGTMAFMAPTSTAALDADTLSQALEAIEAQDAGTPYSQGRLDDLGLFYAQEALGLGFAVAFADESAVSWQGLAATLLATGVVMVLVLLVIAIAFVRWVVRPVQRAWEQQQRFIADASHELKTPLTVILANTSIVESHPDAPVASQRQWIQSTQAEARRMQGLVESMLQLARLEQAAPAPREAVDFSDIAERQALAFEPVAFERGLALESSVEPGLMVLGGPDDLERLCAILLDNACKHGEPGTAIRLFLARSGSHCYLTVRNLGDAIDPKDIPHLFDRFYQTDAARTKEDDTGFGLGLAIAREIAANLGGTIQAASSPQDGTSFKVELPLAPKRG